MAQVENNSKPADLDEIFDLNNNNHRIGKRVRRASTLPQKSSSSKTKAQKVRGRRGALKCLLQMPDDIMWEVMNAAFDCYRHRMM
jgi:hypothetical protein